MYKSPITIYRQQMETQLEGEVLKVVEKYGVSADKEELIKALKYDREQYSKGYDEGYRKGVEDFINEIKEPILALENGDVCPNDHKCPALALCVDCKVHRVKRIIVAAREKMIGGEDDE